MGLADLFAELGTELSGALSSAPVGPDATASHTSTLLRRWCLRAAIVGVVLATAGWLLAAALGSTTSKGMAVTVGYAGLLLALVGALLWAYLLASTRPLKTRRGRGA